MIHYTHQAAEIAAPKEKQRAGSRPRKSLTADLPTEFHLKEELSAIGA